MNKEKLIKIYNDTLLKMENLENLRQDEYRKRNKLITHLCLSVLGIALLFSDIILLNCLSIFVFIPMSIFYGIKLSNMKYQYYELYKSEILSKALCCLDIPLSYDPLKKISPDAYKNTRLFNAEKSERYRFKQYFSGEVNKANFEFYQLDIRHKARYGGGYIDMFHYLFLTTDTNIIHHSDVYFYVKKPGGFIGLAIPSHLKQSMHTKFKDKEFGLTVDIYYKNKTDKGFCISSKFIHCLYAIYDLTPKSNICFAFINGKCHLTITNAPNLFNPSISKPATSLTQLQEQLQQFTAIIALVKQLNESNQGIMIANN